MKDLFSDFLRDCVSDCVNARGGTPTRPLIHTPGSGPCLHCGAYDGDHDEGCSCLEGGSCEATLR